MNEVIVVGLILLAAVAVVLTIVYFVGRRRKREDIEPIPAPPPLPMHDAAGLTRQYGEMATNSRRYTVEYPTPLTSYQPPPVIVYDSDPMPSIDLGSIFSSSDSSPSFDSSPSTDSGSSFDSSPSDGGFSGGGGGESGGGGSSGEI